MAVRRTVTVAALLLVVTWLGVGWVAAWALSRRWSDLEVEHAPATACVETLELHAQDGHSLRAWLFAPDAPKASIVMLHGWRGSRSTVAHRAAALVALDYAVLAPSLRAHGDSAGTRYDFGREAWQDVAACVDELARRRPDRPLFVVGFSYGAAVAAEFAARQGERIDGLVLDSVFADLRGAVRNRCELFLPVVIEDLATWSLFAAAPFVFSGLDDVSPARAAASIRPEMPVLILRGGNDTRVTRDETVVLADALGERATLVVVADAEHDRCFEHDPKLWARTVDEFLARVSERR